jgi:hypothetical protein
MTIDTLEYANRLEAAGVDRKQAEAHAKAIRDTLAPQLATKADLALLEQKLDAKIDTAVARLEAKIDALGNRLYGKIGASRAHFEMLLWKRTAGIIATVIGTGIGVAGLLWRVLR